MLARRVFVVIAFALGVAILLIVRLPNRDECVASGRVVDPTFRHCLSPSGYVQLQEHVTMHAIEVGVVLIVLGLIAFAARQLLRRKMQRALDSAG